MVDTPVLACRSDAPVQIKASSPPLHPHQSPTFVVPPELQPHLETAAAHIRAGRTVAFPTETVYGLGANSLDLPACRQVYRIKGRPADNPLIMHVSSLDMLQALLPTSYSHSALYVALMQAHWPGPLSLLFPSIAPPPLPAPQTNAVRMPAHPLALALIHLADTPVSAPSANLSGRPSPTAAAHVVRDLNGADGLGCILDGGACGVGLESTVVDGLGWRQGGGGSVDVLRPGGLGVEEIERVVREVDSVYGGATRILVHGRPWRDGASSSAIIAAPKAETALPPSTPGQKYRHYSPALPVYLLLPSTTFASPPLSAAPISAADLLAHLGQTKPGMTFGLLHFDHSPLFTALSSQAKARLVPRSLGSDARSAARRLFSGMLSFEGADGIDAILIEGCSDDGLGLAVMERVGKAVGGGGMQGDLGNGEGQGTTGRFWVQL